MNKYFRVGYYNRVKNLYTSKIVKAADYKEAIKKSRIKNIEELDELTAEQITKYIEKGVIKPCKTI